MPEPTPAYIIAEAGVNHNGDRELALQLVDAAAAAGADAVKFQTFRAVHLATEGAKKAAYQAARTDGAEGQLEMLKRLELPYEWHWELLDRCKQRGVELLSTPFDIESVAFLGNELGLSRIKLPSGEITNGPLLLASARTGCDLILSTGMSTLSEVEDALCLIAFGYLQDAEALPTREAMRAAYASPAGQAVLRDKVTLLHCTTEYPAPPSDVNLRAIDTLRAAFLLRTGLSDHTQGIAVAVAAVARGACVIEKHFTLDRSLPGPDHQASLEPGELEQMVCAIRTVEAALGDGRKVPRPSEMGNREVARKSLVADRPIRAGEVIGEGYLAAKRPGVGMSPMSYWKVLGKTASRSYAVNEAIDE